MACQSGAVFLNGILTTDCIEKYAMHDTTTDKFGDSSMTQGALFALTEAWFILLEESAYASNL